MCHAQRLKANKSYVSWSGVWHVGLRDRQPVGPTVGLVFERTLERSVDLVTGERTDGGRC